MLQKLLPFIAFAVLCGFLGILVWKVPSPDLVIVVAVTLGLVAFDVFLRRPSRS